MRALAGVLLLALMGPSCYAQPDPRMTPLKSVRELVTAASERPARALADETRQSLPIPVRSGGRIRIKFLYATGVADPWVGEQLMAPSYLASMDAATGRFEGLQRIRPQSLGQDHDEGEFIGTVTLPPGLTPQDYLEREESLFREMDMLLPAFAAQEGGGGEVRAAAVRFRELFDLIAEPPLRPYYDAVGGEFLRWVDRVATNAG